MPALQSDKDLLDALSLSETEAADAIGKTRQSLNQAELGTKRKYFKKAEIISLVMEARKRKPQLDLAPVESYLVSTREKEQIPDLHSLATPEVDETALRKFKDLLIIVPDFGYASSRYPETANMLMRLCLKRDEDDTRNVIIYTAGTHNVTLIEQKLASASRNLKLPVTTAVEAEDWIAAIPFLILGNPDDNGESYVMTEGRYVKNDLPNANFLLAFINKLAEDKKKAADEAARAAVAAAQLAAAATAQANTVKTGSEKVD